MTSANYTTSATPHITIKCHKDLSITGTGNAAVTIDIDDDSPASRIDRSGETITVTAMDSCNVGCPTNASITIELVSGDLRVTQIKGTLAIDTVNGDTSLRDIGPVELNTVQGDLSLRDVDGDVRVDTVRGDAKIKRIGGQITMARVSGDLVVRDVAGSAAFSSVGGDAELEIEFDPGQSYQAKAGGDIVLRVDGGGAQFNLTSGGDLRTRISMAEWSASGDTATGTLGDGSARVTLDAGGDLLVLPGKSEGFDPDAFSDQVESMVESAMSQFESQMARVQRELEERWDKGDYATKVAERAKRSAERAKRRAERAAGAWGSFFTTGRPAAPAPAPDEPVTDEERLLVLKMVQEGKLSADEAAKLLAAMEG